MKEVVIGTYPLGGREVRLILRAGSGGEYYITPKKGEVPQIVVGAGLREDWSECVSVALHEATEMAMMDCGARFAPAPDWARDNGSYQFIMDHNKFSAVTAMVAQFLSPALPALAAAYKKFWKSQ